MLTAHDGIEEMLSGGNAVAAKTVGRNSQVVPSTHFLKCILDHYFPKLAHFSAIS